MEELEYYEKPGIFSRLAGIFSKDEGDYEEEEYEGRSNNTLRVHSSHRYQITVRRQIVSFQDAVAAADGLKRGEQQILNLIATDPDLREKIKDFMCGVNYAEEGTWEELGDNLFLLAPTNAIVEVAPATPRMSAVRN